MGLCKCPKKKVTNQFCYEHRVNVCEHCMVTNHPKCIVQSYLQWLQDSDYNSICELCENSLAAEECVRLVCYHVYHWRCLDDFARKLPSNTAPAGYTCPKCNNGIFPPINLVSPVAEKLIAKLAEVNWARAGLGLPLVDETLPVSSRSAPDGSTEEFKPTEPKSADERLTINLKSGNPAARDSSPARKSPFADWKPDATDAFSSTPVSSHSAISIGSTTSHYQQSKNIPYATVIPELFSMKRTYDARDSGDHLGNASFDHDENKYRRRSAIEWFGRWFKSVSKPSNRRDPNRKMKRYLMIAVLILIALLTVIIIMVRLGRSSTDSDPFLDPLANPHIRVIDNVETQ